MKTPSRYTLRYNSQRELFRMLQRRHRLGHSLRRFSGFIRDRLLNKPAFASESSSALLFFPLNKITLTDSPEYTAWIATEQDYDYDFSC